MKDTKSGFAAVICDVTANENGYYETSSQKNCLSEILKNETIIIEESIFEIPLINIHKKLI